MSQIVENLARYEQWRQRSPANVPTDYPEFTQLLDAFVNVIKAQSAEWTAEELSAINKALMIVPSFLDHIPDDRVFEVFTQNYPERSFRMWLLVEASRLKQPKLAEKLALHFFESDDSDAVRDRALEILGRMHWSLTEDYAELLWETGDIPRKIAILNALKAYGSKNLERYLEQAATEPALSRVVSAIRAVQEL